MKRMSPKTNRIAQNLTEMPNRNKEFFTGGEGERGKGEGGRGEGGGGIETSTAPEHKRQRYKPFRDPGTICYFALEPVLSSILTFTKLVTKIFVTWFQILLPQLL